jgi:multidrug resistance protein, MATE family
LTVSIPLRGIRQLIALAAPIAGIQLAQVALTTTDLLMMGLIGVQAIAAGGLAITLYNQVRTMCVGAVTAVSNLVAGAIGRAEVRSGADRVDMQARAEVRQIVRAGFLVATVVGVVGGIVLTAISFALRWFGQDAAVLALAQPTIIALAFGLIPMLWVNVLRQFAVGMRRPGSLLWVTLGSIGVNAAINAVLIYGWLGLPVLGLTGIGIATALVNLGTFVVYLGIVRRDEQLAQLLSLRGWRTDTKMVWQILRLGIPISLTYGSEAGIFSVAALIMGSFGPTTLAAHNIVIQLTYIVFQVTIGLSHGSSTLVSRAIGQGVPSQAHQIARTALTLGGLVMAAVGTIYLVAPRWVLIPFLEPGDAAEVLPLARTLLFIAVLQQVVDCAQNIGVGLLRGLGNTTSGFRITLVGYWGVGLPVLLCCAHLLGMRGPGVWLGLCTGLAVTAFLLHRRFSIDLKVLQLAESRPVPT